MILFVASWPPYSPNLPRWVCRPINVHGFVALLDFQIGQQKIQENTIFWYCTSWPTRNFYSYLQRWWWDFKLNEGYLMHDRIATIFRLVCMDKPLHYFVTSVLLSFSRTFFLRNRCQRWLGPVDGYNCYWNSMVFVSCLLGPGVLHIHKTLDRFNTTLFISHNIPMSISGENGKDQDGIIFDLLCKAY